MLPLHQLLHEMKKVLTEPSENQDSETAPLSDSGAVALAASAPTFFAV